MIDFDARLILQLTIILMLSLLLFLMMRFYLSMKLAKRISVYSIEPIVNQQISLFDNLFNLYQRIIYNLSKLLSKSKLFVQFSKRYDKYIDYFDNRKPIDFLSNKLFIAIIFLLIDILTNIFVFSFPSYGQIFIAVIIGFFIPDMYSSYQNYLRHKKLENDILNAIIMLNNAFKSGRSTMQAIEIVKNSSDGPIKEEFSKMHQEITYGLSLESVFKRFAERIKMDEISYITSSLSILNKTGGNIVKVFSSIEKSLFNRRSLESELKSLTASARMMSKILLLLPFIFVGIITLFNPTYFDSLFNNFIGMSVLFVMILFYVIYAIVVQKVMTVRK